MKYEQRSRGRRPVGHAPRLLEDARAEQRPHLEYGFGLRVGVCGVRIRICGVEFKVYGSWLRVWRGGAASREARR